MPELANPLPLKTTLRVAEALRLPATSLDEMMPARIARKGSSRLLVPVGNARALEGLTPNFDTLPRARAWSSTRKASSCSP